MLSEEERTSLREVLHEIQADEERKALIDRRDWASALGQSGNRLLNLPGTPPRIR
jgi:hypothetical protein